MKTNCSGKFQENGKRKGQTGGESKGWWMAGRGERIAAKGRGCAEAACDRERRVIVANLRGLLEWKTRTSCQSPESGSTTSHSWSLAR